MKKALFSLLIFLTMCGFIIYSHINLMKVCEYINKESENIEEKIKSGEWEQSYEASVKLKDYMEDSFQSLSVYVNHQEIDSLTFEILKLSQYIKCRTKDEALASIHVIKYYSKNIKSIQVPTLQNIF